MVRCLGDLDTERFRRDKEVLIDLVTWVGGSVGADCSLASADSRISGGRLVKLAVGLDASGGSGTTMICSLGPLGRCWGLPSVECRALLYAGLRRQQLLRRFCLQLKGQLKVAATGLNQ